MKKKKVEKRDKVWGTNVTKNSATHFHRLQHHNLFSYADRIPTTPPRRSAPTMAGSELKIAEKWDSALEKGIKRTAYGTIAGGVIAALLFRTYSAFAFLASRTRTALY